MKKHAFLLRSTMILFAAVNLLISPLASMEVHAAVDKDSAYTNTTSQNLWYINRTGETGTRTTLPKGYKAYTGQGKTLEALQNGQHYYTTQLKKDELIPIDYFLLNYPDHTCIHGKTNNNNPWMGFNFTPNTICHKDLDPGWLAYCANCGDYIHILMYGTEDAMKSISFIRAESHYASKCYHCGGIEQGATIHHSCYKISYNRYNIEYNGNGATAGSMARSIHYWNNSTDYEGLAVEPQTKLNRNIFSRVGYTFKGWSTTPNGSVEYEDEAEILNLAGKTADNDTITLYAVWQINNSTLNIDPNGGEWNNSSSVSSITQGYLSTKHIGSPSKNKTGFTVSFNVTGQSVSPITPGTTFSHWSITGSNGELNTSTNVYKFLGDNGTSDTVKAIYTQNEITLPSLANKSEGGVNYTHVGWETSGGTYVGPKGSKYTPTSNITLTPVWSNLTLVANADMQNSVNGGKGAVDLSWVQTNTTLKAYKLYKSTDKINWTLLNEGSGGNAINVTPVTFNKGASQTWTVPASGLYKIQVYGAQGGNYGSYKGGKGGYVYGEVFLDKGDILTLNVGGQDGTSGGGAVTSGGFSTGGGYSSIVSKNRGTTLAIAGGGGGASSVKHGFDGGGTTGLVSGSTGQSGLVGGGGGYQGGKAGSAIYHKHDNVACDYHTHTKAASATITGGKANVSGGCYTKATTDSAYCGTYNYAYRSEYCGACHYDSAAGRYVYGYCPNCGHDRTGKGCCSSDGKCVKITVYECSGCGATRGSSGTHTTTKTLYALGCKYTTEGYHCGKTPQTLEYSTGAYGGSSWVNGTYVKSSTLTAGQKTGNGQIIITPIATNYNTALNLNDTIATDLAKPNAVTFDANSEYNDTTKEITVTWKTNGDNGTVYYHKAESYSVTNLDVCELTSNITETLITSGITRYAYRVSDSVLADTTLTTANATIFPGGPNGSGVKVGAKTTNQYLYVAAVDKAGNIGPSKMYTVQGLEVPNPPYDFPVTTSKITLNEHSPEGFYTNTSGTNFLRADEKSYVQLEFSGKLGGLASPIYQVNSLMFDIASNVTAGKEQSYKATVPNATSNDTKLYDESETTKLLSEPSYLIDTGFTEITRYNNMKDLKLEQRFSGSEEYKGKTITIIPRAEAYNPATGNTTQSVKDTDKNNAYTIILDGNGPVISSADTYYVDSTATITIGLTDDLSGLNHTVARLCDMPGSYQEYTTTGTTLEIPIQNNTYVYADCYIEVESVDNVGNVSTRTIQIRDNKAPTGELDYSPKYWTNDAITLKVTAQDNFGWGLNEKPYSWDGGVTWTDIDTFDVYENNVYYCYVKDKSGNINRTEIKINIGNSDTLLPQVVDDDKTYYIDDYNTVGNKAVINIKDADATSKQGKSGLESGKAVVTNKEGKTQEYNLVIASDKLTGKFTMDFSDRTFYNGDCEVAITLTDIAGNTNSTGKVHIRDNVKPVISLTASTTEWTNQDITITPSSSDTGFGVNELPYSWLQKTGWSAYANSRLVVKTNGTYTGRVQDNAGTPNIGEASITISNIDKLKPIIDGLDVYQALSKIDRNEGTKVVDLVVTDADATNLYGKSGLKGVTVTVTNFDNGKTKTWTTGSDGIISIDIVGDEYGNDYLFYGKFEFKVVAEDIAGNIAEETFDTTEYYLNTDLTRLRNPENRDFICGEIGLITWMAGGYPDEVEVRLSEEIMWEENPVTIFTYNAVNPIETGELGFYIPLDATPGTYKVQITSYKYEGMGTRVALQTKEEYFTIDGRTTDELNTYIDIIN